MEIRVRYVVVGLFVLVVGLAGLAFTLWIQNKGSFGGKRDLTIRFLQPATGLRAGAPVTFNGVRVGEVTAVSFDANDLSRVDASVAIDRNAPVTASTKATLETQGLLGAVSLSLTGGDPAKGLAGNPPVLIATQTRSLTEEARGAMATVSSLVSDNADGVHQIVDNIRDFSALLSRNSGRIDSILGGLERTLGGPEKEAKPTLYDLPAPTSIDGFTDVPEASLVVSDPTALVAYDTQRLLVETPQGEITPQPIAWPDSIPKLVQRRVLQTFDALGYKSASAPADNAPVDYQLALDIRAFQIVESPAPSGEVSFGARLMDRDGKLLQARVIRAEVLVSSRDAQGRVAAVRSAFTEAIVSLLLWYKQAVASAPAP